MTIECCSDLLLTRPRVNAVGMTSRRRIVSTEPEGPVAPRIESSNWPSGVAHMSTSGANLRSFSFVLAVPDLQRSASYFRDALGFQLEWPEGSGWQLATRDGVRIMMGHCPDALPPSATGDHSYFGYFYVDDADALHEEFVSRGAIILQAPVRCCNARRTSNDGGTRLVWEW